MLRDMRLGVTERGLLLTMLSLPDNWNFSIKGLSRILPDGCAKIGTALHNLEAAGYLVREWITLFAGDYITAQELNEIAAMIVNAVVSEKGSDCICGQRFPRSVIRSVMLKGDRRCVERAIETMKNTEHIHNYERYLLSTLFNEANWRHLRTNTENRQIDEQFRRVQQPVYDLTDIFS